MYGIHTWYRMWYTIHDESYKIYFMCRHKLKTWISWKCFVYLGRLFIFVVCEFWDNKGIRDAGSTADFRILFEIFEILEILDFFETLKFLEIFEILTLLHFYTVTLLHIHTFALSHFRTFTLSHFHTFTLSHFHTFTLWKFWKFWKFWKIWKFWKFWNFLKVVKFRKVDTCFGLTWSTLICLGLHALSQITIERLKCSKAISGLDGNLCRHWF